MGILQSRSRRATLPLVWASRRPLWVLFLKNLSPKGDALQAQTAALLLMIMNNDDDVHGGGKVVTLGAISGNGAG